MNALNFHHLQYFWAVARVGSLTKAATSLHVAPSAVSAQVRQLEDQLGQPLFTREGRGLALTESGRIALAYADVIFATGRELVSTLGEGRAHGQILHIGAVATLSRNFQSSFLRPLIGGTDARLHLASGRFEDLLVHLQAHTLDVVLANPPPRPRSSLCAPDSSRGSPSASCRPDPSPAFAFRRTSPAVR